MSHNHDRAPSNKNRERRESFSGNYAKNMLALLGNPNAPTYVPTGAAAATDCLPTSARGQFVIQSAGADCVYLSKEDKGAVLANNFLLNYSSTFRSQPSSDLMKDFDDIIIAGGG